MDDLDTYEPTFEEISDPDSPYYDERWFESELLPWDHEWYEIIGDFLLMCSCVQRYEYTGKNKKLAAQYIHNADKFRELVPEIEELIRGGYESVEFAMKWTALKQAYQASGAIKKEQEVREGRGKYERYREERRAWYARVYTLEKAKGKHTKTIQDDVALYVSLIKDGVIAAPPRWNELKFDKILNSECQPDKPRLNKDLGRDFSIKKDIPRYSVEEAPKYDLPPFELNFPDSN